MYTIYHIKNNVNNHIYVGQTKNPLKRNREHFNLLKHNRHSNVRLQRAWNKYGGHNFIFINIKETESFDEVNRWEVEEIKRIGYYNLDGGGQNSSIRSPETLAKISKIHKGKTIPTEMRKYLSEVNTGTKNPKCKLTEEQIYYIKFVPNYNKWGMFSDIARKFKLNRSHVCRIYYGEKWGWIAKDLFDFDIIKEKFD